MLQHLLTPPGTTFRHTARHTLRGALWCFLGAIVLSACTENAAEPDTSEPVVAKTQQEPAPQASSNNGTSTKVATQSGAYLVTLRPQADEVVIGKSQAWVASITDADGRVFTPNALYFDGGMPGHGHGLPSAPRFTQHLGGADFLLEGLQLNMPGDWRFVVSVGGPSGTDNAIFDLNIQPKQTKQSAQDEWNPQELALIQSLQIDQLGPVRDESNRFMGDAEAIELGRQLFGEPGLSATGEVSCATCHKAEHGFADNTKLSIGSKPAARHTPTLLGIAHAKWFYWDGRRDSLWSQALTPLETVGEMDNNRTDVVRYVADHPTYAAAITELAPEESSFFNQLADYRRFPAGASPFGAGKLQWHRMSQEDKALVNRAYATIGKVIASYEATLAHSPSRFDRWAQELSDNPDDRTEQEAPLATASAHQPLTAEQKAGLHLFLDLPKTQCLRCHNGALFTNQGFHNVATSDAAETAGSTNRRAHDFGRMLGLQAVIVDPFNCSGEFSDAPESGCDHLRFARRQNLGETIDGAFKVPTLRNLQATAPYFHDGRFENLADVVDHYRNQQGGDAMRISEVPDIDITDKERDQLVAFLKTL